MFEIVRDDQNTVILFGMFLISTGEFSELWKKQQYDIQRCMRLLNSMGCSGYQLVNFQNFGIINRMFPKISSHRKMEGFKQQAQSLAEKSVVSVLPVFLQRNHFQKTFQMRQKWFSLLPSSWFHIRKKTSLEPSNGPENKSITTSV